MAKELWQWDPAVVVTTIGDQSVVGYAPDTFVEFEYNAEAFSLDVGAGGDKVRVSSQDDSAKLTLTVMEGSPTNDYLSGLYRRGRAAGITGVDIVPVQVERLYGTTLITATKAWISKFPTVGMSADGPTRSWELTLADADAFVGGSLT